MTDTVIVVALLVAFILVPSAVYAMHRARTLRDASAHLGTYLEPAVRWTGGAGYCETHGSFDGRPWPTCREGQR